MDYKVGRKSALKVLGMMLRWMFQASLILVENVMAARRKCAYRHVGKNLPCCIIAKAFGSNSDKN